MKELRFMEKDHAKKFLKRVREYIETVIKEEKEREEE
jgi:hypothetical protein